MGSQGNSKVWRSGRAPGPAVLRDMMPRKALQPVLLPWGPDLFQLGSEFFS